MNYIFYIDENTIPQLTKEQRDSYRVLRENQILPLKTLWNFQLWLCMTTYNDILEILTLLTDAWKNPSILGAMSIDWDDLIDKLGNVIYPRNYTRIDEYLATPINVYDIDWNITETRLDTYENLPIFAGWKAFDYVKLIEDLLI